MRRSFRRVKTIAPSILTAEMQIFGDIIGDGAIEIAGRIDGDIRCLSVKLQPGSVLTGNITAEKAEIHGEVKGDITAKNITCGATAKIVGDIMHQRIHIEDGAYIDGNCKKFIQEDSEPKRLTVVKLLEDKKLDKKQKPLRKLKSVS